MKKKLYFTIDERWSDEINGIKVYQEFEYDTTTNLLKFIDRFDEEKKEISIGTATVVSSNTTPSGDTPGSDTPSGDTPSGETDPDNPSSDTGDLTGDDIISYEDLEVTTSTPLTFRSVGTTTLQLNKNSTSTPYRNIQYSKNNGEWQAYPTDGIFQLVDGDTVAFSGNNVNGFSNTGNNYYNFKSLGDGTLELYGNLMSLINWSDNISAHVFANLFSGCTNMTNASKLLLPIDILSTGCYSNMFADCTNLITAPTLPATKLAPSCYYKMFSNCSSLSTAPNLPATELASGCYWSMFSGCTSLTTAPVLSTTTLPEDPNSWNSCYRSMFEKCSSLVTAPLLPFSTVPPSGYRWMFNGCTSLTSINVNFTTWDDTITNSWVNNVAASGTFTKPSSLALEYGKNRIPSSWTIVDK